MNVENMLKLADFLESLPAPEHFNMDYWVSKFENHELLLGKQIVHHEALEAFQVKVSFDIVGECNTAGCIAGWAAIYDAKYNDNWDIKTDELDYGHYLEEDFDYEIFASNWLGLNTCDAHRLFFPSNKDSVWNKYSSEFGNSYIKDIEYEDIFYTSIDTKSITNKDAAYMLRNLALGNFNFATDGR